MMHQLKNVHTVTATDKPGILIVNITTLNDEGTDERFDYTYSPSDPYGIAPDIRDWLAENEHTVLPALPPEPEPLPNLAPYQFRAMLKLSGMQSALESWIDGLAEPANTIARAKLEFSLVFKRDNDLILSAQQVLGLTDEQLDDLWMQAHAIE